MISKFKSLGSAEKMVVLTKLVLCFFAGALSALLFFKLVGL
jgi:hypothetical protein